MVSCEHLRLPTKSICERLPLKRFVFFKRNTLENTSGWALSRSDETKENETLSRSSP